MMKEEKKNNVRYGIAKELHAPARRHFKRRRVVTKGLDDLWQADVVEMQTYARLNKGMRYILCVIDVYSKYAWAEPLKNKTGEAIQKAFSHILSSSKRKPKHLQTDFGREFYNSVFSEWLKTKGIHHYSTYSTMKACVVERFNRTLKENMYRRFSAQGTHVWLTLLPSLLREYNARKHRTTKMKPKDVKDNRLMKTVYAHVKTYDKQHKKMFCVGDVVRISKYKHHFQKGYEPSWTTELFTITKVHLSNPVTYSLKDGDGEDIAGRFYHEELLRTHYAKDFLVEKILRKKGPLCYVKWLGFDSKHNSWIHKNNEYV